MILQADRIAATSGHAATADHVFAGTANEAIHVLQGCRADLKDMVLDAAAAGKKYAFRHYKLSAFEDTTREQALELATDIAEEFGFDLGRCVILEHEKGRAGGEACGRHWHLMVPEWDPVHRRVLDASWMRPRQEKLSRRIEIRLGHVPVQGRWNAAVVRQLRVEGLELEADAVAPLAEGPRPAASFTAARHQSAARNGLLLPETRLAVADAWRRGDTAAARAAAIRDLGLRVRRGEKAGVWVVETAAEEPVLVGALHRLVREKQAAVAAVMEGMHHDCDEEAEPHAGRQPPGACGSRDTRGAPGFRQAGPIPAGLRHPAVRRDDRRDPGRDPPAPGAASGGGGAPRAAAVGAGGGAGPTGPDRSEGRRTGSPRRIDDIRAACSLAAPRAEIDERLRNLKERARAVPPPLPWQDPMPREVAVTLPGYKAVFRVPGAQEDETSRDARRRRWLAAALRGAYDLDWVPEALVANLVAVDVHDERQAVVLVLRSGTRIVDQQDRIDIVGIADDVAIGELVEAVRRRGWTSVEVHGAPEFRAATARRLRALEPPVRVGGDVPVPDASPGAIPAPAFVR